jgi:hypothetical protein
VAGGAGHRRLAMTLRGVLDQEDGVIDAATNLF